jgi:hypothetical protein
MLTSQRPIVRAVIQDAIDNLWVAMLFTNAFPDVCVALGLIKDCLLTAANCLKPGVLRLVGRSVRRARGEVILKSTTNKGGLL